MSPRYGAPDLSNNPPNDTSTNSFTLHVQRSLKGGGYRPYHRHPLRHFGWKMPWHKIHLRGRFPLKLRAVPEDYRAGNEEAGKALLSGIVRHGGREIDINALNFRALEAHAPLTDYLQSFAWLNDLAAVAPRQTAKPIAETITKKWLADYADRITPAAWLPEQWGWRILHWTSHASIMLYSLDLVHRSTVLLTLARGARHLGRTVHQTPKGLPRLVAWAGLLVSSLLIEGTIASRGKNERGLIEALRDAVGADGGLRSRCPHEQSDLIVLLSLVDRAYTACKIRMPEALQTSFGKAIPPVMTVLLGDGARAAWQGSTPGSAQHIRAIVQTSRQRGTASESARALHGDWGYQNLSGGHSIVVMDVAPPPYADANASSCASTLAFELSDGPCRLVVNCGGAAHALVPHGTRAGLRSTAAHSTLTLGDYNSSSVEVRGGLGKRGVRTVDVERTQTEGFKSIAASHDGYARHYGVKHHRKLSLRTDGAVLQGEDWLSPAPGKARSASENMVIRFHLGWGVGVERSADESAPGHFLTLPDGGRWHFALEGGTCHIENSLWVDEQGWPHTTQQLVILAQALSDAHVQWQFSRLG